MKFVIIFVLVCVIAAIGEAAVGIIPPNTDPKNPGYCFYEEVGALKKDESKNLKKTCAQITCTADKSMRIAGCGSVGYDKNKCKLVSDTTKPYPECCPKIKC